MASGTIPAAFGVTVNCNWQVKACLIPIASVIGITQPNRVEAYAMHTLLRKHIAEFTYNSFLPTLWNGVWGQEYVSYYLAVAWRMWEHWCCRGGGASTERVAVWLSEYRGRWRRKLRAIKLGKLVVHENVLITNRGVISQLTRTNVFTLTYMWVCTLHYFSFSLHLLCARRKIDEFVTGCLWTVTFSLLFLFLLCRWFFTGCLKGKHVFVRKMTLTTWITMCTCRWKQSHIMYVASLVPRQ